VEAQVAVTPEEVPYASACVIAQTGDAVASPLGAEVGAPGRAALEDGERVAALLELDAELVAVLRWDAGLTPASHARELCFGYRPIGCSTGGACMPGLGTDTVAGVGGLPPGGMSARPPGLSESAGVQRLSRLRRRFADATEAAWLRFAAEN